MAKKKCKHKWGRISRAFTKHTQTCRLCGKKRTRRYSPARSKFYYTYP